jgi:D-alanyl-D-alanine carboxypeptidase
MYNKYLTMKRSELKEAIKNEITSVLLEGMSDEERENRIQHLMRTGAKEKPLRKLAAIGKKEDEKDLKEGKKGVVVDPDEIMMHINQYQSGNIDGDDLAQAIEEILVAMMNKSVTFSDIREEDEEPTSADLKKKDSVASISNKLQKLTAKMKKKAKEFKEAEGKAKDKIKDELKDMTAEKKKLEKDL